MNRPKEGDRVYITPTWWTGASRKAVVLGSEERDLTDIVVFLKVDAMESAVKLNLDHMRELSVVEEIAELDG